MANSILLVWLISIFTTASSSIIYLTNEKYELMEYAVTIATLYKIDKSKFLRLIDCESRWNPQALGDYRIEQDRFMARGLLQWWKSSWDKYTELFDLEHLDYKNPKDQIVLASVVISKDTKGWKNWFNCGKVAGF